MRSLSRLQRTKSDDDDDDGVDDGVDDATAVAIHRLRVALECSLSFTHQNEAISIAIRFSGSAIVAIVYRILSTLHNVSRVVPCCGRVPMWTTLSLCVYVCATSDK